MQAIGHFQENGQGKMTGEIWINGEYAIIAQGFGIGFLAALLPSIQAYRSNISKTLGNN